MMKILKFNFGQTTLEIGMAIAMAIILVVAAISVWNWVNKTMVERYQDYNASRLAAVKDIRGSTFGMQPTYVTPKINIFSLDVSIGNAPPPVPPGSGGGGYYLCYDDLNASLTNVTQMRTQVNNLTQEISNLTGQALSLKSDLGMNVGAAVHTPPFYNPPSYTAMFSDWTYGSGGSGLFNDTFDEIEIKFYDRLDDYSPPTYVDFYKDYQFSPPLNGWPGYTQFDSNGVASNYINPGKSLEDQATANTQLKNQLEQDANALETQAWQDFYACIGEQPPGDPCFDLCRHFMDDGNTLMQQALAALAAGNYPTFQILSAQADQAYGNFTVCYDNCTSSN